ncbi:hypothetical protein Tco_1337794 [Tanacetum coccineum]
MLYVHVEHELEENDEYWVKKLPDEYQRYIEMSDVPLNYTTKKELYLLFCRGFLANNGHLIPSDKTVRGGDDAFSTLFRPELIASFSTLSSSAERKMPPTTFLDNEAIYDFDVLILSIFLEAKSGTSFLDYGESDDDANSSDPPPPTDEWKTADSIVKSWIFLTLAPTLQDDYFDSKLFVTEDDVHKDLLTSARTQPPASSQVPESLVNLDRFDDSNYTNLVDTLENGLEIDIRVDDFTSKEKDSVAANPLPSSSTPLTPPTTVDSTINSPPTTLHNISTPDIDTSNSYHDVNGSVGSQMSPLHRQQNYSFTKEVPP